MASEHFLCKRCGVILTDYSEAPPLCPKCGGIQILNIGSEDNYKVKELRKKYKLPFRADVYHSKHD